MQFFSRASSQNGGDGSVLRRDFRGADTEQESAAGSRRRPNFGSSNPWYYKSQYPIDGYMYVSVYVVYMYVCTGRAGVRTW